MADTEQRKTGTPEGNQSKAKDNSQRKTKNKQNKDKPKQTQGPILIPPGTSTTLAPPSAKAANDASQNKRVTNEPLINDSVFVSDSGFQPAKREILFSPSTTGWTATIDAAYSELRQDPAVQVAKELPIEALRYYASCVYWLRVIGLKLQQGHDLTPQEVEVV